MNTIVAKSQAPNPKAYLNQLIPYTTFAFFKENKIWAHWLIFARIDLKGEKQELIVIGISKSTFMAPPQDWRCSTTRVAQLISVAQMSPVSPKIYRFLEFYKSRVLIADYWRLGFIWLLGPAIWNFLSTGAETLVLYL